MHSELPKHDGAEETQKLLLEAAWYKRLWWRYTQTAQRASPPPRYLLVVLLAAQIIFLAVVRLGPAASVWTSGSTPPLQPSSTLRFVSSNAVQALPQQSSHSLSTAGAVDTSKISSHDVAANAEEVPLVKATSKSTAAQQRTEKKNNYRKGKPNPRNKERLKPVEPLFNGGHRKEKKRQPKPKPLSNRVRQSKKASTTSSASSDDLLPSVDKVQPRADAIISSVSNLESGPWNDVEQADSSGAMAENNKPPLEKSDTLEKKAMDMEIEGYEQTLQPLQESKVTENKTEEMEKPEVRLTGSPAVDAALASDSHVDDSSAAIPVASAEATATGTASLAVDAALVSDSHVDDSSAATPLASAEATATGTASPAVDAALASDSHVDDSSAATPVASAEATATGPTPSSTDDSSSPEALVSVKETDSAILLTTALAPVESDSGDEMQGKDAAAQQVSDPVGADEERIRSTGDEGGLVSSSCEYGYIYVYDLPPQFNHDITANCSALNPWVDVCRSLMNGGLGEAVDEASTPLGQVGSWYISDQFTAELVFHNRILQHPCLTDKAEVASGFYVPFYAGLDVGRYLWGEGNSAERRDRVSREAVEWLQGQAAWKRRMGADHFMMVGRITWDFRRSRDEDWGSAFFYNPGVANVTRLLIERNPWDPKEMGVPYPTNFHPQSDADLRAWQHHLRRLTTARSTTFSFAGAPRPSFPNDFRAILLAQCLSAPRSCKALDCSNQTCDNNHKILELFMDSVFCLQPRGDSFTRRSTFDCLLAGSIPVFFWRRSAYLQYQYHLPADETTYSVFISKEDMRNGTQILQVLESIPPHRVRAMQEAVIQLLPRIVYAASGFSLKEEKDAFDVAMDGVMKRFHDDRQALASDQ